MTDLGRQARWTAAAVLGPVAAALFAGTTVWAARAPIPTTSSQPTLATAADPAHPDGGLQQTLDDEAAQVAALERVVASLRTQAAALVPGSAKTGGSGPTGAAPVPSPAHVSAGPSPRMAARPPAVHVVTGGS